MAANDDLFPCVRVEGAILPADLLRRIAAGDRGLDGLRSEDYHLVGKTVNEATSQAWTELSRVWEGFRPSIDKPPSPADESVTLKKWMLPFWNALGYGQLDTAKPFEIDGKQYPISHARYHSPIHLVGFRQDLDKRVESGSAKKPSPHGMVQEFLNRSDTHLWAFVSNGLKLRVLRDNIRLTRQAFVEFDLQAIFDGKAYADFALLWRLCHESRVKPEKAEADDADSDNPADCWLERWSKVAADLGIRALDELRDGVRDALEALGRGFLHPRNIELIRWLRDKEPHAQEYYRQLLRVVYRLLFLFVAEDRGLLFDPSASEAARKRYTDYYSTARLRRIAEQTRGTPHTDMYHALELVLRPLGRGGCPQLGLSELGGLFELAGTPNLNGCVISNADLLEGVRALSVVSDGKSQRSVDYRNLGAEELGSVYESLLELKPQFTPDPPSFVLKTIAGNERKTTSSYYTHRLLISTVLDSSLEPLLDEAVAKPQPEAALLNLKVCDPAVGSGHFLIAAAHRIAKRLASVRNHGEEPAPDTVRHALREVIGRCVYGVDMNPMAVELCQVALWMEGMEPGKPLSFLKHHIQLGNALLGTAPALLAGGIPDKAFKPIKGSDDKAVCKQWAKANKSDRQDQRRGRQSIAWEQLGSLPAAIAALDSLPDDTPDQVRAKQDEYERLVSENNYRTSGRFLADLWCSAFVCPKTKAWEEPITERVFRQVERNPDDVSPWLYERIVGCPEKGIRGLREEYQFFHWHLAFPGVFRAPAPEAKPDNELTGWCGGFDLILGNPPWDTLSPDAKEFFSAYDAGVRATDKAGQKVIIQGLLSQPGVAAHWEQSCREIYSWVHFIKDSGRYDLFAPGNLGKGDFNVFRMFVETALQNVRPGGRASQVVPEGLYNGANSTAIRQALFERCDLSQLLAFENTNEVWFKGVHTAQKFCIYSARLGGKTTAFRAAFNIRTPERLVEVQGGQGLVMPVSMVREFSPQALAVMELGSQKDIDIAAKMYRWPKFGDTTVGPPMRRYMREVDMGTDRDLFTEDSAGLPVYEGRMVAAFDHRAKGYRSGRGRSAKWADLPFSLPTKSIQPQWYIPADRIPEKAKKRSGRYRVAFCDVASPTNERTLVAALVPPKTICGHSAPTFVFGQADEWCYPYCLALANSFVLDFISRMKVSLHMSFTIHDSLPFPRLASDDPRVRQLVPLGLRLTCTSPEMTGYWNLMASQGLVDPVQEGEQSPGISDEDERLVAMAEIDAVVARDIFELTRAELEYVLDTFPTYRGYQEEKYGEYRSRRLILEVYDALETASREGHSYQSRVPGPLPNGNAPYTLAALFANGCPAAPFSVKLADTDVGAGRAGNWQCLPITDGQPIPAEGTWVLVRHDGLRRGSAQPGIAVGQLALNPIDSGMEVLLKGGVPPATLRLTAEQWKSFRPLAVLKPLDRPE